MKKAKIIFTLIAGALLLASINFTTGTTKPDAVAVTNFEVVMPWGLDHERGQIIQSMIENHTTLGSKYNYTYTQVGGSPSDRSALVARFLAGDYPNLVIVTQDWYTEWAEFGIWHDFSTDIAAWTSVPRTGWQADIPAGWWSILDKTNGDGSGSGIYALPFFGQSILPYINLDDFAAAGLTAANVDNLTGFLSAAETLKGAGKTPFAMVGKLQSDIAYMNYMFGSTDNFIDAATDPATVFSWDTNDKYGVNGSLNVEGFAAYLKLKGEGWVQSTVDTDGGGEVNSIFGAGNASMVLVGPWGTSIFMGAGLGASSFTAVPMWKSSDGVRSTITGGGISFVPKFGNNASELADASELAQWLLDDENQMKTVENWLNSSWRIPVRQSLKTDPWFTETGHPERANFITHIESQVYAFPWGKQHPEWISVHESVMMPGYRDTLLEVEWGVSQTDQWYTDKAQAALNQMAANIQCYSLGGPCVDFAVEPSTATATVTASAPDASTITATETKSTPGFELYALVILVGAAVISVIKRKRR